MNIRVGYKMYHGSASRRNRVGIIVSEILQDKVVDIQRKSDLLVKVKIALSREQIFNVICRYGAAGLLCD